MLDVRIRIQFLNGCNSIHLDILVVYHDIMNHLSELRYSVLYSILNVGFHDILFGDDCFGGGLSHDRPEHIVIIIGVDWCLGLVTDLLKHLRGLSSLLTIDIVHLLNHFFFTGILGFLLSINSKCDSLELSSFPLIWLSNSFVVE